MLATAMHHGLTTVLDDRHFGLLTLIVLLWLIWGYVGMRSQRAGRPDVGLVMAWAAMLAMLIASPWLALGAVQWILATALGILWERRRAPP